MKEVQISETLTTSVGVASTVAGFQVEFTTGSLEAIFANGLAKAGVDDFGRRRGDAETKLFCGASARHSSCVIQEPICWTAHDEIEYGPAAAGRAHSHVQIQKN